MGLLINNLGYKLNDLLELDQYEIYEEYKVKFKNKLIEIITDDDEHEELKN